MARNTGSFQQAIHERVPRNAPPIFALGSTEVTGAFPRCDETFQQVAPPEGEVTREGIAADLRKIAATLESHPGIDWPDEPANELERRYREIIDNCPQVNSTEFRQNPTAHKFCDPN